MLIENLEARGAKVDYSDPYVSLTPQTRKHDRLAGRKSQSINKGYDCIVIAAARQDYNGAEIARLGIPAADSRRLVPPGPNIYQA